MPSWNELIDQVNRLASDEEASRFLRQESVSRLRRIGQLRSGRHVILYTTAFLQKPAAPQELLQIDREDLNAFMSVMRGMEWNRGLALVLHTPGGVVNAAETLVAYLREKFEDLEVIVPTYAMSAGTMLALGSDRIVMGRQSQLGPIDPLLGGDSALAIVNQFEEAKKQILKDGKSAVAWYPILQTIGPSRLQAARDAIDYGRRLVARWLESYMFADRDDPAADALATAKYFSDSDHLSHGRRIDRNEARENLLKVVDLEDCQELQEAVLTLYHLATIIMERGGATKILHADTDTMFVKNWVAVQAPVPGT